MIQNILIIGSGWLGWPLAQHLTSAGHQVTATTTSELKIKQLSGTAVELIKLNSSDLPAANTVPAVKNADIMIIVIPPGRQQTDYLYQLQQLVKLSEHAEIGHILFISSTGVYGQMNGVLTEYDDCAATTQSGRAMVAFEQQLLTQSTVHNSEHRSKNSVLRLAGLFGPNRHPGKFLAGKVDIANPDAVVNMIHQQDCIGLISQIIMNKSWGRIHLGCAPSHPTRREFYSQGAKQLDLPAPQFVADGGQHSKLIDSTITANHLDYQYVYPDLMAWL